MWFTFAVLEDAPAESYERMIELVADGHDSTTYDVNITVRDVTLPV